MDTFSPSEASRFSDALSTIASIMEGNGLIDDARVAYSAYSIFTRPDANGEYNVFYDAVFTITGAFAHILESDGKTKSILIPISNIDRICGVERVEM